MFGQIGLASELNLLKPLGFLSVYLQKIQSFYMVVKRLPIVCAIP